MQHYCNMQGITINQYVNSTTRCKDMIAGLTVGSEKMSKMRCKHRLKSPIND